MLIPLRAVAVPAIRAVVICAFVVAAATAPAEPFPIGKCRETVALGVKALEVFTYRPANFAKGPLLIVMHGVNRNADDYRDSAVPLADASGLLVVAPRFDNDRFPSEAYQRGNVLKDGVPQPREQWTYDYVARLIAEVRRRESRPDMPCYLIGHSAGGQFLTRYAAFLPGDAIRIVAANPGTHLFPTRDLPFPYGFGGLPESLANDDAIRRYLAAPLTLLLGTADTGTDNLDMKPDAMKQGATRLERGRRCFQLAEKVARDRGWALAWRLVEVEGVGHSSEKMFASPQATAALFGKGK